VRCLMGAGATGIVIYMIDAMGRGWCFTFVAGVVALFSPILWILEKWGPQWREARRVKVEEAKARMDRGEADFEHVDVQVDPEMPADEALVVREEEERMEKP